MVNSSVGKADHSLPSFARSMLRLHPPLYSPYIFMAWCLLSAEGNCTCVFTCCCCECASETSQREVTFVRFSPLLGMLSALGSPTSEMAVGCNRRQIRLCGMLRTCSSGWLKARPRGFATGRVATDWMANLKVQVENKWRYLEALPDLQHSRSEGGGN